MEELIAYAKQQKLVITGSGDRPTKPSAMVAWEKLSRVGAGVPNATAVAVPKAVGAVPAPLPLAGGKPVGDAATPIRAGNPFGSPASASPFDSAGTPFAAGGGSFGRASASSSGGSAAAASLAAFGSALL